jgi:hypothetical protein
MERGDFARGYFSDYMDYFSGLKFFGCDAIMNLLFFDATFKSFQATDIR